MLGTRLLAELKRRKVVHSAGWYLGAAFVVMQVVEVVFPPAGLPDSAASVVLAILVAGFPVALAISWAFQVSPPRFRREIAANDDGAARMRSHDAGGLRRDSVAVLPFENLSDDPQNAYFSDGITDDIITSVAHIQGLRVLSRTSSMRFKGASLSVGEIAQELRVATVVTGSVRRHGSRVRVMAEVIDAHTDDHLWTDSYDRELEDIFEVQSEIASKIAAAVQRELSHADRRRIEMRGTTDAKSYDLYLRARFLWNQRSEASVAESTRYFQLALERDPSFALAHAGLADAYAVLGIYGMRDPRDVLEAAHASAEAALAIDPQLGEAVAVRACVQGIYRWRWADAEAGFLRAIELSPSYATAYQWYATNLLTPQRRFDEAQQQLNVAVGLNPASGAISVSEAVVHFYARDLDTAVPKLEAMAALHPRFSLVFFFLGQCYELMGDLPRGVETLRRATELGEDSSETLAALGHALGRAELKHEAEAILSRLEERAARRFLSPALLAQVLIGLGRVDEAFDRLEEAARLHATDLIWLRVRPVYDPLKELPRFRALESTLGLRSD